MMSRTPDGAHPTADGIPRGARPSVLDAMDLSRGSPRRIGARGRMLQSGRAAAAGQRSPPSGLPVARRRSCAGELAGRLPHVRPQLPASAALAEEAPAVAVAGHRWRALVELERGGSLRPGGTPPRRSGGAADRADHRGRPVPPHRRALPNPAQSVSGASTASRVTGRNCELARRQSGYAASYAYHPPPPPPPPATGHGSAPPASTSNSRASPHFS